MWTARDRELYRENGKRYPSDPTAEEWSLTSRLFANYRPLSATIREIVEACLYLVTEGCRWRALPKDFPPWQTVRWWWDRFRREGVWEAATHVPPPAAPPSPGPAWSARRACAAAPRKGNAAGTAARS